MSTECFAKSGESRNLLETKPRNVVYSKRSAKQANATK